MWLFTNCTPIWFEYGNEKDLDIMFPIRQTEMDEQEREMVITFHIRSDWNDEMKWMKTETISCHTRVT